ncbi:MAG: hypothetical protein JSR82_00435 [Verrucomicrobia bacterium]|nr:hypothetical protein [Verrucomicrobiota bacterium]
METIRHLVLPRRYERLESTAMASQQDVSRIIVRVDHALRHLQETFAAMHRGDVSGLEIFFGPSGVGKTTFLASSHRFLEGLNVHRINHTVKLKDIVPFLKSEVQRALTVKHLFYLHDRENQRDNTEEIVRFFDDLRREFRKLGPSGLVVWPISREDYAQDLIRIAEQTGSDSLLVNGAKYFTFSGPPKAHYYSIANETSKLFNSGRALSEFGIAEALGQTLLAEHDTVASYFSALGLKSEEINKHAHEILKRRPRPRVWILVAGDDAKELWGYVRSLTYRNQRALDIPAFTLALAKDHEDTHYRKQWQTLGDAMPYILSYLDVRIIEVPPRLSLAIARAFGQESVVSLLNSPTGDREEAIQLLRESIVGELLTKSAPITRSAPKKTETPAAEEYNRLQTLATKKRDGELHEAFRDGIEALLKGNLDYQRLSAGQRVEEIGLNPDIFIELKDSDPICLEFTWRTSKPQKTYTPGHIQQYVLNKTFDYVSALGLEKLVEKIKSS